MEKLRLTQNEREELLSSVKEQLDNCHRLSSFKPSIDTYLKLNPKDYKKPIVQIPADAYLKMFRLVHNSTVEIQWHGLVKRDLENQIYTIYDILVFPQVNTATSTNTDTEEYGKWINEKITDFNFPLEDMRLHGHSHVNMSVFSSSIDDGYQTDLLSKVEEGDYYLYLILNKKHEICPLLYDMHLGIMFDHKDILIEIIGNNGEDIDLWAAEQIDENCREIKTKNKPYYQPYNNMATPYFDSKILGGTYHGFK